MAHNIEGMDSADDPNRCQTMTSKGQCPNMALKTEKGYTKNCNVHGGVKQEKKEIKDDAMNYRLSKYQGRLQRHAGSAKIKSLREEIGLLRMLLEERINRCTSDTDLLLQSQAISDLVLKIEKVVASCHRLEGSLGQTLDKQAILQFASEVITIIGVALEGEEDKITEIADGIMEVVGRIGE